VNMLGKQSFLLKQFVYLALHYVFSIDKSNLVLMGIVASTGIFSVLNLHWLGMHMS
jgi:hypothetical protein